MRMTTRRMLLHAVDDADEKKHDVEDDDSLHHRRFVRFWKTSQKSS